MQVVVEEPWWERHNITLPRTIYKLKEIATLDEQAVRPLPPSPLSPPWW
eukprot:COSAG06_NODE_16_length_34949_cov_31.500832_17_plen_49_part_00